MNLPPRPSVRASVERTLDPRLAVAAGVTKDRNLRGDVPLPLFARFPHGVWSREPFHVSEAVARTANHDADVRRLLPAGAEVVYTGERSMGTGPTTPGTDLDLQLVLHLPEAREGDDLGDFGSKAVALDPNLLAPILRAIETAAGRSEDVRGVVFGGKAHVFARRAPKMPDGGWPALTLPTRIKGPPMPPAPEFVVAKEAPYAYVRDENVRAARRSDSGDDWGR